MTSKCEAVRDWMAQGEAEQPSWVAEHQRGCGPCARLAAQYEAAVVSLRSSVDAPPPFARVAAAMRATTPAPWWRAWVGASGGHEAPWWRGPRLAWLAAPLAAAVAVALWLPRSEAPANGGLVIVTAEGARVETAEASRAAVPGAAIVAGDLLRTDTAALTVADDRTAALTVEPRSRVRIEAWEPDRAVIMVDEGAVTASVEHRAAWQRFEVRTPDAVVRVVGTRFTVTREAGWTHVATLEGVVRVEEPAGGLVAILRAGESVRVGPGVERVAAAESQKAVRPREIVRVAWATEAAARRTLEAARPAPAQSESVAGPAEAPRPSVAVAPDAVDPRPSAAVAPDAVDPTPSVAVAPDAVAPSAPTAARTAPATEITGATEKAASSEDRPAPQVVAAVARPPEQNTESARRIAPKAAEAPETVADTRAAAEAALGDARGLLAAGRDADAIDLLKRAADSPGPHQGRLLALLGDALRVAGRLDDARDAYDRALGAAQPPPGVTADLATLLERDLDRPADAARAWRTYLDAHPAGSLAPQALFELARLETPASPDRAEAHLRALLDEHPDTPEAARAYAALGRTLLDARRWAEARALFAAATDDPHPPRAEAALVGLMRVALAEDHPDELRALARTWSERFPQGARAAEVRRLLGALR